MNKKGLSYIDWAISFGIFVISVILLFVLINPYFSQEYSNEYLLSLAKQGLEESAYVELSIFPLYVYFEDGEDGVQNANLPVYDDLFSETESIGLIDSDYEVIENYEINGNKISFDASLSNGVNTFYILYFNDVEYVQFGGDGALCDQSLECTFGIEEKRKAFFVDKLGTLFDFESYNDFKMELTYPLNKNIIIEVYGDGNIILYNSSSIENIEPTKSDNIYVLSWNDYLMDKFGNKELIKIIIKVW
jgi:hypothetical protein